MGDATRHIRNADWVCGICGTRSLTWRLVHGHCACDTCGADYSIRDGTKILDEPRSILVKSFYDVFKAHWDATHQGLNGMTQAKLSELSIAANLSVLVVGE